jgi:hypothetical protein
MSEAILAALLGRTITLFHSFGKLAAPRFASAPETSRQALVPIVKMLPTRLDCRGLHSLGGLPCLRAKVDNFPASRQFTLQRCVEIRRDVKLNHLRHDFLLMPANLYGRSCNSLMPPVSPTIIHPQLHPNRIKRPESVQKCSFRLLARATGGTGRSPIVLNLHVPPMA